jgi:hypothetical protein
MSDLKSLTEESLDKALSHPIHDKMSEKKDKDFLERIFHVSSEKDKIILNIMIEKMIVEYYGESYKEIEEKANSFQTKIEMGLVEGIKKRDLKGYYIGTILGYGDENKELDIENIVYKDDKIFYIYCVVALMKYDCSGYFTASDNLEKYIKHMKSLKSDFYLFYTTHRYCNYYFYVDRDVKGMICGTFDERDLDISFIFIFPRYEEAEKFVSFFKAWKVPSFENLNRECSIRNLEDIVRAYAKHTLL